MLTVKTRDVVNGVYSGREPGPEDVIVVPASIPRIVFPFGLNAKGLMTGAGVRVICNDDARLRHAQLGGGALFKKSLFCGALDAESTVMVMGDLVSWMGDLVSRNGSLIARGEIRSSGAALARNGTLVSDVGVFAETRVFSLNTWSPKMGERAGLAQMAVAEAERMFGLRAA